MASRRRTASLHEIVLGEKVVAADQVVEILKTFQDDQQRVEALKAILGNDEEKSRRIVEKVKADVDVGSLNLKQQESWTRRLNRTGFFLLLFAIIGGGFSVYEKGAGNVASQRVVGAVDGWGNGTAIIRKVWWDYAENYKSRLAQALDVTTNELQKIISENPNSASQAKQKVFEEYENFVHPLLAEQKPTADPLVVNPILRENLRNIEVPIPGESGAPKSLNGVLDEGLPMTKAYFEALFQAVANGRDPTTDPEVCKIYDAYLSRRQAVFDACIRAQK